uniref:Uncharacterized protein n=1 Tax=Megaselia scalaris TaxID=36166 RepID=T1GDI1_MEGSC
MEAGLKLKKPEKGGELDCPYQELIGGLLLAARITRPDINFAVNYFLAWSEANPSIFERNAFFQNNTYFVADEN